MNKFITKIRFFILISGILLLTVGIVAWQVTVSAQPAPHASDSPAYHLLVIERTHDAEHTLYQLDLAENGQIVTIQTVLSATAGYQLRQNNDKQLIFARADGTQWQLTKTPNLPTDAQIKTWIASVIKHVQPLSGPREFVVVPNSKNSTIFVMTGEADNTLNLYLLDEAGQIQQLTYSAQTMAENSPLLSTSVEFIAWRPLYPTQFLYRVRVRDMEGHDTNQLYLYDLAAQTNTPMPYFGKSPVWSPDGLRLVGARFNEETRLYELWQEDITTHETTQLANGCNPQFSPDGRWLAYDAHTSSQNLNYTDCFANGEINLMHMPTRQRYLLTEQIGGYAQIIAWQN